MLKNSMAETFSFRSSRKISGRRFVVSRRSNDAREGVLRRRLVPHEDRLGRCGRKPSAGGLLAAEPGRLGAAECRSKVWLQNFVW